MHLIMHMIMIIIMHNSINVRNMHNNIHYNMQNHINMRNMHNDIIKRNMHIIKYYADHYTYYAYYYYAN